MRGRVRGLVGCVGLTGCITNGDGCFGRITVFVGATRWVAQFHRDGRPTGSPLQWAGSGTGFCRMHMRGRVRGLVGCMGLTGCITNGDGCFGRITVFVGATRWVAQFHRDGRNNGMGDPPGRPYMGVVRCGVWSDVPCVLRFGDDRLRVIAVYGLSGRAAAGQTNGDGCFGRITVFVGATRRVAQFHREGDPTGWATHRVAPYNGRDRVRSLAG
jgi:hypothetical protein